MLLSKFGFCKNVYHCFGTNYDPCPSLVSIAAEQSFSFFFFAVASLLLFFGCDDLGGAAFFSELLFYLEDVNRPDERLLCVTLELNRVRSSFRHIVRLNRITLRVPKTQTRPILADGDVGQH
jgi:hypothetical protein